MSEPIQTIEKLIEQYQEALVVKRRLKHIKKELFEEQEKQLILKQNVDDEYADITVLEKKGLRHLFVNILINREEQLKEERQEYLMAVLKVRESEKLTEQLKQELSLLEAKSIDQELIFNKIEREIEGLDESVLYKESVHLSELKVINIELRKLLRLKVEAREAIQVAKTLHKSFIDLIQCLNQAKSTDNWGVYYSDIQRAKKKQQQNIDHAHFHAQEIKRLIIFLKGEIEDVIEVRDEFRRTEAIIYEFNISFYDHLLEDWIKETNLIETMTESTIGNAHLIRMIDSLEGLMNNASREYRMLSDKKKVVVESLVKR